MTEPLISFRGVSKRFEGAAKYAVRDLSFDVSAGELVAVVGQTGCGKSTMFNLLTGLLQPTVGDVRVAGHDPFREFNALRGKFAVVFQSDRLLPWRTALHNVAYGLELLHRPAAERLDVARKWLKQLGLAGHEDDYPHALSGGMRQRVSIARAFAVNPDILLCDEPFSALDELTAESLRNEFAGLIRATGKTAIFITHSINEAIALGSRVLVFRPPAQIAMQAWPAQAQTEERRALMRESILAAMTAQ